MEDVQVQWRNFKDATLDMIVNMDQIIDGLNNPEDNFNWGQNMFDKRFEAIDAKKYSHVQENIIEVDLHNYFLWSR